MLQRAALEGWSRPQDLFTLFTALLEQDPFMAACIARTARPFDPPTEPLSPADIGGLANNKLLHCMMISAPINDEALEHLLTRARRALLELADSWGSKDASDAVLAFCSTLARQWASRPAEFHRQPLSEPSVKLSPHWAPIRRTSRSYRVSSVRRSPGTPQPAA